MNSIDTLIGIADAYKVAAGVTADTTVSHRVFGDTKKLAALRCGGDITTKRFHSAMCWFSEEWPAGKPVPAALKRFRTECGSVRGAA